MERSSSNRIRYLRNKKANNRIYNRVISIEEEMRETKNVLARLSPREHETLTRLSKALNLSLSKTIAYSIYRQELKEKQ